MPGGSLDSFDISLNSPAMPDNFIHFAVPKSSSSRSCAGLAPCRELRTLPAEKRVVGSQRHGRRGNHQSKPSNASNYSPRSRAVLAMLVLSGLMTALHGEVAMGATNQSTVPRCLSRKLRYAAIDRRGADSSNCRGVPLSLKPASSVAVYTDRAAEPQTVLGPRDWRCSAYYGADENGGYSVSQE